MGAEFDSWAVVELMGHVRMAGRVTEEERCGATMGRIDVPDGEGGWTTVYFSGASVYRMTPVSEEAARAVAIRNAPEPVHPYEMRKAIDPPRILPFVPAEASTMLDGEEPDEDGEEPEF